MQTTGLQLQATNHNYVISEEDLYMQMEVLQSLHQLCYHHWIDSCRFSKTHQDTFTWQKEKEREEKEKPKQERRKKGGRKEREKPYGALCTLDIRHDSRNLPPFLPNNFMLSNAKNAQI